MANPVGPFSYRPRTSGMIGVQTVELAWKVFCWDSALYIWLALFGALPAVLLSVLALIAFVGSMGMVIANPTNGIGSLGVGGVLGALVVPLAGLAASFFGFCVFAGLANIVFKHATKKPARFGDMWFGFSYWKECAIAAVVFAFAYAVPGAALLVLPAMLIFQIALSAMVYTRLGFRESIHSVVNAAEKRIFQVILTVIGLWLASGLASLLCCFATIVTAPLLQICMVVMYLQLMGQDNIIQS